MYDIIGDIHGFADHLEQEYPLRKSGIRKNDSLNILVRDLSLLSDTCLTFFHFKYIYIRLEALSK